MWDIEGLYSCTLVCSYIGKAQTSRRSNILCRVCCRKRWSQTEGSASGQWMKYSARREESNCLPVCLSVCLSATHTYNLQLLCHLPVRTALRARIRLENTKKERESREKLGGTPAEQHGSTGARELCCKLPVKILLTCQQQTSNAPWE